MPSHHRVQEIGREKVFSDYRIRIAQVIHEARPGKPTWQPERRTPYNDPARRPPTYVIATESKNARLPVQTAMAKRLLSRASIATGQFRAPRRSARLSIRPGIRCRSCLPIRATEYFRIFEVMRDYGMFDRTEAPQFYPPIVEAKCTSG